MKVGSAASSGDAGGRHTKCKISAAEVPMYRFSSVQSWSAQGPSSRHTLQPKQIGLTPVFNTGNVDVGAMLGR